MDIEAFVQTHTTVRPDCCGDTSTEWKIYRHFKSIHGDDSLRDSTVSLQIALEAALREHTSKGGADNTFLEGLFSICRALGLIPAGVKFGGGGKSSRMVYRIC